LIVAALCVAVAWTPWALVWADDLARQGRAGQVLGRSERAAFAIPELHGGALMLPADGAKESVSTEDLFPGADAGSVTDFSALYGDDEALGFRGSAVQADLLRDGSAHGAAFQTLYGSYGLSDVDLRNDPVWSQTDPILADLVGVTADFADCAIESTFLRGTRSVHVPRIETCQRVQQGGSCTIRHDYDLPPAEHGITADGGAVVSSCGHGCVQLEYDDRGSGHRPSCPTCGYLPPHRFGFRIAEPDRVERIRVTVAPERTEFDTGCSWDCKVDALFQSWSIDFPGYSAADRSAANFDPINRERVTDRDVTAQLRNGGRFTVGNDYRFLSDGGRWYVAQAPFRVTVRIELQAKPLVDHGWVAPDACINLARTVRDSGLCSGDAVCVDAPPLAADGCYQALGVRVCPSDFGPSPIPWLSPFCREIAIDADCAGFNSGPMHCWTDPQGQTHCPYNAGDIADTCESLERDLECGYLGSTCVEGARDPNGFCYVTESRYDCGTTTEIPSLTRDSAIDCAGPVRCLGDDCLDLTFEQSDDFAEAAAALQAAQFAVMDGDCTEGGDCQVFAGESAECKRAVGGVVDCCDTPSGVSLTDYIQLIFAVSRVDAAIMALDNGSTLRGGWELLRDPLVDSWDAVSEAFTSAANSLTGSTSAAASDGAARLSLNAAKQALMRQTAQWTANVFGDAAANALFAVEGGGQAVIGGTVQAGNIQLGGLVGTTLAWAMTAYMIYSVVMILIRILWRCERDEFELGAKRALRSCHSIGSYCDSKVLGVCIEKQKAFCCFNTPLARIVNEQAFPQLGRSWGNPKRPDCAGLSLSELERLDWSRIDLSEWLAILDAAGQFPSPGDLDIEALTGSGSVLDTGGRAGASKRSMQRAEGLDAGRGTHEAEQAVRDGVLDR
jgi:conjugal transfer mating pair stabilization protein TraN